jgi:hypothetical protein
MDFQAWLRVECCNESLDALIFAREERDEALFVMITECRCDDVLIDEKAKVFVHTRTMGNCPTPKKEEVVLFGFEVVDDNNESRMIR